MKSNYILKLIILLSILLVIALGLMYRTTDFPVGHQTLECLGSIIVLSATALFLHKIKAKWLNEVQKKNVELGLYFGLLWTIEISINNILRPGLPLRDTIDNVFWVIIALLILSCTIHYSYQNKKISLGIIAGFWSGLASGGVACITALTLIIFGMKLIILDSVNVNEWLNVKPNNNISSMAVYFAYETLAGAIMHLVFLGAGMGLILGIIGGIIGKTLGSF